MISGVRPALDLPQVDRKLVEENEGWLVAEEFGDGLGAGGNALLVGAPNPFITFPACQCAGNLAPRCIGEDSPIHSPTIGRVGILSIEGSNLHITRRDKRRVNKLGRVRQGNRVKE